MQVQLKYVWVFSKNKAESCKAPMDTCFSSITSLTHLLYSITFPRKDTRASWLKGVHSHANCDNGWFSRTQSVLLFITPETELKCTISLAANDSWRFGVPAIHMENWIEVLLPATDLGYLEGLQEVGAWAHGCKICLCFLSCHSSFQINWNKHFLKVYKVFTDNRLDLVFTLII